jgi:hypothetical protein
MGPVAKCQLRARRQYVPAAALHLALQLARRPSGKSAVQAVISRLLREQRLDVGGMHGQVNVLQHMERCGFRRALRAKQRDLHLAHHRPARIKRLAGLLMLARRRAVEDHAHGAAVLGLRDQDHGLAEVRVDQVRLGDEQDGVGGFDLRKRRSAHQQQQQKPSHAAKVRKVIE